MSKQPDSAPDSDRLDQVLADYMEEAEAFKDNLSELCALQTKYVEKHPDLATQLLKHFENENVVLSGFGRIPCRLADFGRYTGIRYIGHGGMGVVYKAFDEELKVPIALKVSLPGSLMAEASVERFRVEAQSMAKLKHPNIVRVHDVGEHQGRPFLSMELAEGGNLAQHRERFAADQRSVAKLMVQVARAVHHAHQRRILHRDLKPANILLDPDENESTQDKPYVTDFGLAQEIGADGLPANTGGQLSEESQVYKTIAGTAAYMSPEQAEGKDATTLSDVYGLGATMYSLQTGKSPFGASTVKETLRQVRDPGLKPKSPRTIDPRVDRTLEAICLKCLRHDPDERYRSAEGLAKDLGRWLDHRPTRARPLSRLGRSRLWRRRNPLGVGLALMILAFLTLAGVIIADIIAEPGRALVALARQNAETLQLRLEQLRQAVGTARDPRLGELLTQRNFTGLQTFIEETGTRRVDLNGESPFESWFILADADGEIVARWPEPAPLQKDKDRRFRDYYKGALQLAKTEGGTPVYVSRIYKAISDDLYKFGICAAVRDGEKIVGAVVASVTTSPQMGLPELESGEFTTALLARKDSFFIPGEPRLPDGASEFLVLLHPAYERGTAPVWISSEQAETIRKSIADNYIAENYHDPVVSLGAGVTQKYGGRWVAGFAPVEGSEFIVVVQRRYSETIPAALWPWIMALLAAFLAVAIVWFVMPPATSRR